MRPNKINLMKFRVAFYEEYSEGPEVGGDLTELYECYADVYEPTTRDAAAFGTTTHTHQATVTIRNETRAYRPLSHHKFMVLNGYYRGVLFDIERIAPYSDNPEFLKIVGRSTDEEG